MLVEHGGFCVATLVEAPGTGGFRTRVTSAPAGDHARFLQALAQGLGETEFGTAHVRDGSMCAACSSNCRGGWVRPKHGARVGWCHIFVVEHVGCCPATRAVVDSRPRLLRGPTGASGGGCPPPIAVSRSSGPGGIRLLGGGCPVGGRLPSRVENVEKEKSRRWVALTRIGCA